LDVRIRQLGVEDYATVWDAMKRFTAERDPMTPDELWVLEHSPVYTLGLNGDPGHAIAPLSAPLVRSDRGGQITYHGPGQLVIYVLIDLARRGLGVRALVSALEATVIGLCGQYGLLAETRPGAPGVYVAGRKLASLGLRVRRGCSYHGLSVNVDLDLSPFDAIHPCGYQGLPVTSLAALGISARTRDVAAPLLLGLITELHLDGPAR
jgi:lipoyl(octanoyl) transferase